MNNYYECQKGENSKYVQICPLSLANVAISMLFLACDSTYAIARYMPSPIRHGPSVRPSVTRVDQLSLHSQSLGMSSLNVVFTALVVSRIEYALPSFSGFLSRANIDRLNAALRKARRWGITDIEISMEDLMERSDSRLFSKVATV